MKIKEGYIKRRVLDEWIVAGFGEEGRKNGQMVTLNDTAAQIWDALNDGKTPDEIAGSLVEQYGITRERADRSVSYVVSMLSEAHILEE